MIESENDIMVKCIICFTTCTTVYYLHCILHVERVSDCCLMLTQQFFSYIIEITGLIFNEMMMRSALY
jgi:hypothetical protein